MLERHRELMGHDPCNGVGRPAGRVGDDERDRARWEALRAGGGRRERRSGKKGENRSGG